MNLEAEFSRCGNYRRTLRAFCGFLDGQSLLYIAVNPSLAGKLVQARVKTDPTARKFHGFARRIGAREWWAGNVFDLVATKVNQLSESSLDPCSKQNDDYLRRLLETCNTVVPCWGRIKKVPKRLRPRFDQVRQLIRESGKPCQVFGLTKDGDPAHPLMLPYSTKLVGWTP